MKIYTNTQDMLDEIALLTADELLIKKVVDQRFQQEWNELMDALKQDAELKPADIPENNND